MLYYWRKTRVNVIDKKSKIDSLLHGLNNYFKWFGIKLQ